MMRRTFFLLTLSLLPTFTGAAMADQCPSGSLNVLTNGTPADASAVMGNFNFLLNCINSSIVSNSTVLNGNVGINNGAPISALDVGGTITVRGNIFGPANTFAYTISSDSSLTGGFAQFYGASHAGAGIVTLGTAGANRVFVLPSGNVGIGTGAPSYALHVANGPVAGAGAYVNLSDMRLKKDIAPISYGLDTVMKLRPVEFNWKDQSQKWQQQHQLGLIAQEVEKVVPEAVSQADDKDHTLSLAYGALVPVLIKAVQELQHRNEALEAANAEYRRKFDLIDARLSGAATPVSPERASWVKPAH